MSTVVDTIKLVLLIGMVITYLLGQGWLGFKLVSHENGVRNSALLHAIPLALVCGLIANLSIILIFQDLKLALIIGSVIAIIGIYSFIRDIRLLHPPLTFFSASTYKWIGAVVLCLMFLGPISTEPLKNWDARSIWFFHAKMIYTAGSIGQSAGWQDASVLFSHPDYPILVPALASQITTVVGFWNEFMPKLSLFILFIPPILWLFTFARKSISSIFLLLLIPFTFDKVLWSGLMDGYLALYFSVAILLLGRYVQSFQFIDLISGSYCLALLLYLKNEGVLAALIGACIILLIFLFQGKTASLNFSKSKWRYYVAGFLAFLPFLLWTSYKYHWQLSNDLELGSSQSINRLISRIADGSYRLVLESIYRKVEGTLLLLTLLCFAATWKKSFPKEALPALLAAGIYGLGLITIYLLTPHDLEWQIRTTINRTTLSINAGLFVGCYFILRAVESKNVPDGSKLIPDTKLNEDPPLLL